MMVEHSEPETPAARRGHAFRPRDALMLVALLIVVGVVSAVVIGSHPSHPTVNGSATAPSGQYAGLAVQQAKPAPGLRLDNYLGTPVNIANYRGKAVLVTFLYTHCPDVCPLIASKLHTAWTEMSASERSRVEMIAVSVDPRGDTPTTVAQFLREHEDVGELQYLIGSASALAHVWAKWGISAEPSSNPAVVDHSALIYGITARGKIAVVYLSSFKPSAVVHDVPLLASS